jgi:hypothetical protein
MPAMRDGSSTRRAGNALAVRPPASWHPGYAQQLPRRRQISRAGARNQPEPSRHLQGALKRWQDLTIDIHGKG